MDVLILTALIIGAVILFLVELFFIPGLSVAGISAVACILYAIYYAFTEMGSTVGILTIVISVVTCITSLVWFMRSKTLDKLSLKKEIDSSIDRSAAAHIHVGAKGISTTRLAQIGYAEIDGNIVEVKSADGFIDEKTPVQVIRITDGIILVEKQ